MESSNRGPRMLCNRASSVTVFRIAPLSPVATPKRTPSVSSIVSPHSALHRTCNVATRKIEATKRLPVEVWSAIMTFLSAQDLCRASAACRGWHAFCNAAVPWRALCLASAAELKRNITRDWKTFFAKQGYVRLRGGESPRVKLMHDGLASHVQCVEWPHWECCVQTAQPLRYRAGLAYFEMSILSVSSGRCVCIGVSPSLPQNVLPGNIPGSVSYDGDNGHLYCGEWSAASPDGRRFGPRFGVGDVVGCGYYPQGDVFFTLNGHFVGFVQSGVQWSPLLSERIPTIGVQGTEVSFHTNFGLEEWWFNPWNSTSLPPYIRLTVAHRLEYARALQARYNLTLRTAKAIAGGGPIEAHIEAAVAAQEAIPFPPPMWLWLLLRIYASALEVAHASGMRWIARTAHTRERLRSTGQRAKDGLTSAARALFMSLYLSVASFLAAVLAIFNMQPEADAAAVKKKPFGSPRSPSSAKPQFPTTFAEPPPLQAMSLRDRLTMPTLPSPIALRRVGSVLWQCCSAPGADTIDEDGHTTQRPSRLSALMQRLS